MASMDTSKVVERIEDIVDWVDYNGKWPTYIPKPKNEKETKGNLYAEWLRKTGYKRKNLTFVYANVKMPDGRFAEEVLDEAYKRVEYHKLLNSNLWDDIEKLRKFCYTHNAFPMKGLKVTREVQEQALKLANWLGKLNFKKDRPDLFLFPDLMIGDEKVFEVINSLANLFYKPEKYTLEFVLARVRDLQKYCRTYKEWPKYFDNPKTVKENEANFLVEFLKESGYLSEYGFKYPDLRDEKGILIKDILDKYYAIFRENINDFEEKIDDLNIWMAKDSKDVSMVLYYYILKLVSATDFQMYQYYLTMIDNKIKEYNLDLKVNEILRDLMLGANEQVNIYYDKYLAYKVKDDKILSKLYYQLYLYSKKIDLEVTEEVNLKK